MQNQKNGIFSSNLIQTELLSGGRAGLFVLREHCVGVVCGEGCVRGAAPGRNLRFPARCSIVALRAVGHIARFAPHLQVAVSAAGRAPFRRFPVFTQNHATPPARPRFFYAPAGAWVRATLGALPLRPRQGTEFPARCSIVALRPIGRIARFAPHLQVAVSATGRAPFRCLPVFTQNHATPPARPRFARTLRVSFMRLRARGLGLR